MYADAACEDGRDLKQSMDGFEFNVCIEPLLDWFRQHARALPWREYPDAYQVWVSEIMLQQTRVEAVKPYYERFLRELPSIEALAGCPEDRLLKLWEGLGYYNRVRHMQAAARIIMRDYGGRLPEEYEQLLKLPGIGHYTAGAIASIAYGKPYPAVDGNVLRVLTRLMGDASDIAKQSVRNEMENWLGGWMQQSVAGLRPETFNQALMELGALVCLPNGEPQCGECPWQPFCVAHREGRTAELPVKSKAGKRRLEKRTVLLIREGDKVAISKRADRGLLAGLYELPNCEGHLTAEEAVAYVQRMGYDPLQVQALTDAKHIFSHIEWHMIGYVVRVADFHIHATGGAMTGERATVQALGGVVTGEKAKIQGDWVDWEGSPQNESPGWIFVETEDVANRYAIPAAFARYTAYLELPEKVNADAGASA